MKPNQYPTTHEIARQLLAKEDVIAVLPMPVFDMPGQMRAEPLMVRNAEIDGRKCMIFCPIPLDQRSFANK
jgi:hypothetical protein